MLSYIKTSYFPPFQDACAAITEEDEVNEAETAEQEHHEDDSAKAEAPMQGVIYHMFVRKTLQ